MKTNSLATKTKEKMNAVSTAVNGAVISAMLGVSNMLFAAGAGSAGGSVKIKTGSAVGSMGSLFSNVAEQFLQIFFYIGVLVVFVGGGMLGLAIKNDDADGKSKAFLTMAAGIFLITLKTIMGSIGVI